MPCSAALHIYQQRGAILGKGKLLLKDFNNGYEALANSPHSSKTQSIRCALSGCAHDIIPSRTYCGLRHGAQYLTVSLKTVIIPFLRSDPEFVLNIEQGIKDFCKPSLIHLTPASYWSGGSKHYAVVCYPLYWWDASNSLQHFLSLLH